MRTTETGRPGSCARPILTLQGSNGSRVTVSTHGGQVLSWSDREKERLFTSPRAVFNPGQAIRGGIPIIFPQFGERGPGPRHGFARLFEWQPVASSPGRLELMLSYSDASLQLWPHRFRAQVEIDLLGRGLSTSLSITNCGGAAFEFTAAMHTYLRVSDLENVAVLGLQERPYLDARMGCRAEIQDEESVRFADEVDRIYPDSGDIDLVLRDGSEQIGISSEGFPDTVIWNPGAELAASIGDLGASNHAHFVCVEAASVERPVLLAGGATWRGSQTLSSTDGR